MNIGVKLHGLRPGMPTTCSPLQWAAGVDERSLAALRVGLATVVLCELVDRWPLLHAFYTDEGILPVSELDTVTRLVSVHAWSGRPETVRRLVKVQAAAALCMAVGLHTRLATIATWFLYVSMTLRNCGVAYIADRYVHFFLFLSAFTPLGSVWSVDAMRAGRDRGHHGQHGVVSSATVLLRLQLIWIYADAGWGKALDPEGTWTLNAPVPALATMLIQTPMGLAVHALLAPRGGLAWLTASVVWAECWLPPLAWLCAGLGWSGLQMACVVAVIFMHVGIALCMNNAILLSTVASVAWLVFVPASFWAGLGRHLARPSPAAPPAAASGKESTRVPVGRGTQRWTAGGTLLPLATLVVAFNLNQSECDLRDPRSANGRHLASTLLHNRWNVFTSGGRRLAKRWLFLPALPELTAPVPCPPRAHR